MNRRSFFKSMIGGVAAAAAVRTFPFRVFSFPKENLILTATQVRFVKAYDPIAGRMITRFDVLYGFGGLHGGLDLENIRAVEACHTARAEGRRGLTQEEIDYFKVGRAEEYGVHILGIPALAEIKNDHDSKQMIVGWDADA